MRLPYEASSEQRIAPNSQLLATSWQLPSFGPASFQNFHNPPALLFTDRSGLDQLDSIANLTGILLIVRLQLCYPAHVLVIHRVRHIPVNGYDDCLVHLVAHDVAEPLPSFLGTFRHQT